MIVIIIIIIIYHSARREDSQACSSLTSAQHGIHRIMSHGQPIHDKHLHEANKQNKQKNKTKKAKEEVNWATTEVHADKQAQHNISQI